MKKKTLGIVLNVFIVLLILMNVMLIVMIVKRGSEPLREEEPQQTETPVVVEGDNVTPTPTPVPEETQEETRELVAIPTTKVNVRSKAGTDGDKLGSAEETDEFPVTEVLDEWTKLSYKDKEAYYASLLTGETLSEDELSDIKDVLMIAENNTYLYYEFRTLDDVEWEYAGHDDEDYEMSFTYDENYNITSVIVSEAK